MHRYTVIFSDSARHAQIGRPSACSGRKKNPMFYHLRLPLSCISEENHAIGKQKAHSFALFDRLDAAKTHCSSSVPAGAAAHSLEKPNLPKTAGQNLHQQQGRSKPDNAAAAANHDSTGEDNVLPYIRKGYAHRKKKKKYPPHIKRCPANTIKLFPTQQKKPNKKQKENQNNKENQENSKEAKQNNTVYKRIHPPKKSKGKQTEQFYKTSKTSPEDMKWNSKTTSEKNRRISRVFSGNTTSKKYSRKKLQGEL